MPSPVRIVTLKHSLTGSCEQIQQNHLYTQVSDSPINPAVIRWARETLGVPIDDVVDKFKRKRVDAKLIAAWEDGSETPTYKQLERLAYEVYKRPLAVFFFPKPPQEVSPKQFFPTLSDHKLKLLSPQMRLLIRKATAFQISLAELYDEVNPSKKQIVKELVFAPDTPVSDMAEAVRDYLSVSLDIQIWQKDSESALKFWRKTLEDSGVFVFKDAFKDDVFSGFSLYDDMFPLIYINNMNSFNRQIFTLFHELAHLLFKMGGADPSDKRYLDYQDSDDLQRDDDLQIEILCNKFANEFLVPSSDFGDRAKGCSINETTVSSLSSIYHVSREIILQKFLDCKAVSQAYYEQCVVKCKEESRPRGAGGYYYTKMGVYLSNRYMRKAFSQYYRNQIDIDQLASFLGVKVKSVSGIEEVVLRSG